MPTFSLSAPPTTQMAVHSISWYDVKSFAQDAINLLEHHGDLFQNMIRTTFRMFQAVTLRDYKSILELLCQTKVDVVAVIVAIKLEFQLE